MCAFVCACLCVCVVGPIHRKASLSPPVNVIKTNRDFVANSIGPTFLGVNTFFTSADEDAGSAGGPAAPRPPPPPRARWFDEWETCYVQFPVRSQDKGAEQGTEMSATRMRTDRS